MASGGENVVRPSVLDRLAGRVPKNVPGPQLRSGLRELRAAVARDLETLLNTTAWLPWDLFASRELSGSPLAYGIPDVSAHSWLSQRDGQTMCAAIEQAIRTHEPRLEPRTASPVERWPEHVVDREGTRVQREARTQGLHPGHAGRIAGAQGRRRR